MKSSAVLEVGGMKKNKRKGGKSPIYYNYIDGQYVPARSGRRFLDVNPSDKSDILGEFPESDISDVNDAVQAAKKAFKSWRKVPAPKRAEILFKVAQILIERKEELSKLVAREMGKVIREARADVQEAIDTAYHHAGEGRRLFGFTTPSELQNKMAFIRREPIGVCGLITPWNFPIAIPSWKLFPAIVSGNTVVFKPASDTPLCAAALVDVFREAGLPDGVLNLVHGRGTTVGRPLVTHPDVPVVSFTGSVDVGKEINELGGKQLKRVSCELGGKNAQVVMDDADLDLAVEGAIWGAFGTSGQRCTATSRIIVHKKVKKQFLRKFLNRVNKIKIGNATKDETEVGPLVNHSRLESVEKYVKKGKSEGLKMLCGGKQLKGAVFSKGYFFAPTVFDNVKKEHTIAQEEIFGPVVAIMTFDSIEEAIDILNSTTYGLSSSMYTQDVNNAFKYIEDSEHGVVYVNSATIGAEAHLPFGGFKNTGNGHREGSHQIYDVFTEWKTVVVDYSGTLQKAQMDEAQINSRRKKRK